MNRAERRRREHAEGRRATKQPARRARHARVPRSAKDLPFKVAPGPDGTKAKVAACRCGWMTVGPNADNAFAEHLATTRVERSPLG